MNAGKSISGSDDLQARILQPPKHQLVFIIIVVPSACDKRHHISTHTPRVRTSNASVTHVKAALKPMKIHPVIPISACHGGIVDVSVCPKSGLSTLSAGAWRWLCVDVMWGGLRSRNHQLSPPLVASREYHGD
jgi:hypothetical protein